MPRLLLIDDEPVIQHAFRKAFHLPEYETTTVRTASEGLLALCAQKPDAIVLDIHLPDADGLIAFDKIKKIDARVPIILITGHGTTELAIEAMRRGAFDYLLKPLQYEELRSLVGRACESSRLMKTPTVLEVAPATADDSDALVGRSAAMQEVYKQIGRVSDTDATVLILGESGTGKELIARAIYQHSKRRDKPFLTINCGAIPETLIESELFGHERGAFTGAERKRIGKFEQCHGGTLFLDEIGELPLLAQVRFLRILQEQKFERVGGTEAVTTDVRLLAATNLDLEKQVASGLFRADLYYRLNVVTIKVPPLRDRGDDLDLLIDYYVARISREFEKLVLTIPPDTRTILRSYSWPGNVRELVSCLKKSILQMSGSVLLREYLPISASGPKSEGDRTLMDWDTFIAERFRAGSHDLHAECQEIMERQLLTRVLQQTGGNQVRAAEVLGITRGTLRTKLKSLGILIERMIGTETEQGD